MTHRLRELPIVEKVTVQEDAQALRVSDWQGRSHRKTTGGSTGRPVTIEKNPDAIAQEMAASWLAYGWFGVRIGDPCVRFWGQPIMNMKRRLRYMAADAATNRITLSAFGYNTATLNGYVRRIRRFGPAYLYGYVSVLEDLARHVTDGGDSFADLGVKSVITTSEVLSNPQRALIRRAFNAPVQNEYGCGEVGPIAYECPEGSLHLLPLNQYIEILDDSDAPCAPGQPGSVVITDLTNSVMPLVRYRVGDTASTGEPCKCGRAFPVLANVFGREYDFVESSAGQRFHGEYFMYLFEDLRRDHRGLGQFKVTQLTVTDLLVQIIAAGEMSSEDVVRLKAEVDRRLPQFNVAIEWVDLLPRQASGKMRVVENRVAAKR